jgi:cyclic pyranopterin phosphate synthase
MALLPWTRRLANLQYTSSLIASTDDLLKSTAVSCKNALHHGASSPRTSSRLQQVKWHSAMPQPRYDDEDTSVSYHNTPPTTSNRIKWRESLPSVAEVAQRLKTPPHPSSHLTKSNTVVVPPGRDNNEKSSPKNEDELAPLSWQDIVQKARAAQAVGLLPEPTSAVLTDTFGRQHTYLRISLTEKCNLRCLYCMPEEGVDLSGKSELLSVEEMHRLATLFAAAGVTKIRLTGGEPTLRKDLVDIVRSIASIEGVEDVGLTSNGVTLGKNLAELKKAGLNLLNISLDTLRPDRFEAMTRRKGHSRVLDTIYKAVELGYNPVKVNVVVMRGVNDDELSDFVELTKDAPINVRFIEYMPFDGNVWSSSKMVPYKEMMERAGAKFGGAGALERCLDASGEVAKNYRLPGHQGEISFISSMTSKFCGDCNRVRLMADGNLKVCLFGANEVSLRDAMRGGASDGDLHAVVSAAVNRKKAAHAGMFELAKTKNRAMVKIGG